MEIERRLLEDLRHYGIEAHKIDWQRSQGQGDVFEVQGKPLKAASNLAAFNQAGETIGTGDVDFVVLIVEIEFRAFWSLLEVEL